MLMNNILQFNDSCIDLSEISYIGYLQENRCKIIFKNSHIHLEIGFSMNSAEKEYKKLCDAWIMWNANTNRSINNTNRSINVF